MKTTAVPEISVVIPVFNEGENLNELYDRLQTVREKLNIPLELLFVNDGSTDQSINIIQAMAEKDSYVKFLDLSRNFGHQIAVSAGIDNAFGNYVAIIDADLQDPPEILVGMYEKIKEGYDVVYARRRRRRGESWLKKITASIFYRVLRVITHVEIPLDTGDFRIMHSKVAGVLRKMPEQHKFIRGQIAWAGFRQTHLEFVRDTRRSGKTSYSYGKMFRFAKDGITSFSDLPLKIVTRSGFFVAFITFFVAIYSLYSKFILGGAVPGWASLMISMLFLGGIQLISIGIMGEYISRIASNVRNRPLYVISDSNVTKDAEEENGLS